MIDQATSRRGLLPPVARLTLASLLTCSIGLLGTTHSFAGLACKPMLSFKNVREVRPAGKPIAPWIWRATIIADKSYCATRSGSFEIDFVQIKEYAPDVQFTEKLRWDAGQFDVSIELDASEFIVEYRLGFIAPCVCREFPLIRESLPEPRRSSAPTAKRRKFLLPGL